MQNDESIWTCIGPSGQFCSYKHKIKNPPETFCRNPHNLTGMCTRVTCPLANSLYATVLDQEGVLYLYVKTPERAHTPKHLWEKIKLPRSFAEALQVIDRELEFWPAHQVNRVKQRVTRIRQVQARMRKLATRDRQVELVPIKQKTIRREKTREEKALTAADVDAQVRQELMDRLKTGQFEIFNYPQRLFEKNIDDLEEDRELVELDQDEENSLYSADMEDELANLAFVEDNSDDEDEDQPLVQQNALAKNKAKTKNKKKIIEYEDEDDQDEQELALA
jgi:protein MAK16